MGLNTISQSGELNQAGNFNDAINSIRVSPGTTVQACLHNGGAGGNPNQICQFFTSDNPQIGPPLGGQISYLHVFLTDP